MIRVWIAVAVVLVAAGALVPVLAGRRNRLSSNDEAVEDVEQLDDERAMARMRTARERYDTGPQLREQKRYK